MRYTVRFTNGFWRVRDLLAYDDAGIFGLKKLADEACQQFNRAELAKSIATRVLPRG